MLLLTLKRQDFVQFFVKNCVKYGLDPDLNPKLVQKSGTETGIHSCGSTTLGCGQDVTYLLTALTSKHSPSPLQKHWHFRGGS
jgi:hypothetical protein